MAHPMIEDYEFATPSCSLSVQCSVNVTLISVYQFICVTVVILRVSYSWTCLVKYCRRCVASHTCTCTCESLFE